MNRLFFDIETVVNPDAIALMPEPKAPGNLKDPEKIKAAIAEKKSEQIEQAALDPDYGMVRSIATVTGPGQPIIVRVVGEYLRDHVVIDPETGIETKTEIFATEIDLIGGFWWKLAETAGRCVGYNILSFDLPFLLRRSMALDIAVPMIPNLAKYRVDPVTDLMAILFNWGGMQYKSMKLICKLYGIPNPLPDLDGSKVKDMDDATLRAYQANELGMLFRLYEKMNHVYFDM